MSPSPPLADPLALDPQMTRAAAMAAMTRAFADAGLDTPDLDARRLACGLLGIEATDLICTSEQVLGTDAAGLAAAAGRRLRREPVSRILGRRGFWSRDFEITPATLDPRPDSETLIELALDIIAGEGHSRTPLRILDIGTGSGCLLVTLLAELPLATGLGTDISQAALEVAARNARRHDVAGRASWLAATGLAGVAGTFDVVISNPPYIPTHEIAELDPEVRAFDPIGALDGGVDGLDVYRAICSEITNVISNGWIVFEVSDAVADPVEELLCRAFGEGRISARRRAVDLGGHTRCVAIEARSVRRS